VRAARRQGRLLKSFRRPWLNRLVVPYTTAGNYGVLWVVVGVAARRPVRVAATVWGTLGSNYAVKLVVNRERPAAADTDPLVPLPRSSSFPSSHAAMSTAAAIVLCREVPRLAPLWVAMAATMAASRIYVGAHHTSDVVAGVGLGAITGTAAGLV
jgi:membrane-associated phospholipid phosphatase